MATVTENTCYHDWILWNLDECEVLGKCTDDEKSLSSSGSFWSFCFKYQINAIQIKINKKLKKPPE